MQPWNLEPSQGQAKAFELPKSRVRNDKIRPYPDQTVFLPSRQRILLVAEFFIATKYTAEV